MLFEKSNQGKGETPSGNPQPTTFNNRMSCYSSPSQTPSSPFRYQPPCSCSAFNPHQKPHRNRFLIVARYVLKSLGLILLFYLLLRAVFSVLDDGGQRFKSSSDIQMGEIDGFGHELMLTKHYYHHHDQDGEGKAGIEEGGEGGGEETKELEKKDTGNTIKAHGKPLEVLEVYPPVRVDGRYLGSQQEEGYGKAEKGECTVVLMEHVFAYSFGAPFVANYTPPVHCTWTHVLFNLTMTSSGRQFDRLATMWLGDIEVFRTCTAEPSKSPGIIWNYVKDMTAYSSLLRSRQKIIFDLGNLVNKVYTASYNATLTATFYTPPSDDSNPIPFPAPKILPISTKQSSSSQSSLFQISSKPVTTYLEDLPKNTIRAVLSLSASGNSDEEFWYTHVPSEYATTFGTNESTGLLPGNSPFREIQVLIQDQLVGVVWPFPVIFTGGANPALWRPIVGIGAFDVPEYEIDVTAFLPLLLDKPEVQKKVEIRVAGWSVGSGLTEGVGNNWLVSGRLFLWTDSDESWKTTGSIDSRLTPAPEFKFSKSLETGTISGSSSPINTSLELSLTAHRSVSVSSTIHTSKGSKPATWFQSLSYRNTNLFLDIGNNQSLTQETSGTDNKVKTYSYPLSLNITVLLDDYNNVDSDYSVVTEVQQELHTSGTKSLTAGTPQSGKLDTKLDGKAVYRSSTQLAKGSTNQKMTWSGTPDSSEGCKEYQRDISGTNLKIVSDKETINGVDVPKGGNNAELSMSEFDQSNVEVDGWDDFVFVGRGRKIKGADIRQAPPQA